MLTQTHTNPMSRLAFVRLPMSTPVSPAARRRPAMALLPHPSIEAMLRVIKDGDPLKYAALVEVTTLVYERLKAERRKAFLAPATP